MYKESSLVLRVYELRKRNRQQLSEKGRLGLYPSYGCGLGLCQPSGFVVVFWLPSGFVLVLWLPSEFVVTLAIRKSDVMWLLVQCCRCSVSTPLQSPQLLVCSIKLRNDVAAYPCHLTSGNYHMLLSNSEQNQ